MKKILLLALLLAAGIGLIQAANPCHPPGLPVLETEALFTLETPALVRADNGTEPVAEVDYNLRL